MTVDLESLIRTDYERCHPNDSPEDLKRRSHFAKADRGLRRVWLTTAARPMSGTHRERPANYVQEEASNDD